MDTFKPVSINGSTCNMPYGETVYEVQGEIVQSDVKIDPVTFYANWTWDGSINQWDEEQWLYVKVETLRFYGPTWRFVWGETLEEINKEYLLTLL